MSVFLNEAQYTAANQDRAYLHMLMAQQLKQPVLKGKERVDNELSLFFGSQTHKNIISGPQQTKKKDRKRDD